MVLSKYTSVSKSDGAWILFNAVSGRWVRLDEEEIEVDSADRFLSFSACIKPTSLKALKEAGCINENAQEEETAISEFAQNDYSNSKFLQMTIIPTQWCNFTCRYCYQEHAAQRMQDEVCNSILRFLTKNLSDFDLLEVGWFGGEPLCALERICSMMRKISASCLIHKVSMFSTMATNGYLLTPDVFSRLYKAGVCNYQITLDGFAPVHDYFRHLRTGGGTFERIMENLLYIKNNTQYERANILIRINVSKKLLLSLSDFVRFLADRFGGDPRFFIDFQRIMDLGGTGIDTIQDEIIGEYDFGNYIRLAKSLHLGMNRYEALLRIGGNVCKAARKNAYVIDFDGSVNKCSAALEDEINRIGYLDTDGNMHLDQNKLGLWMQTFLPAECDYCEIYPLCYVKACPYNRIRIQDIACPKKNNLIQIGAICGKE